MKGKLFFVFWCVIGGGLIAISLVSRDQSNAMIARVESRVISVSFEDPVKIQSILVVPGQKVNQGDVLLIAESSGLDLDLDQKRNQLAQLEQQMANANREHSRQLASLKEAFVQKESELRGRIEQLQLEIRESRESNSVIEQITGSGPKEDSLRLLEINQLASDLDFLRRTNRNEQARMTGSLSDKMGTLKGQMAIINKELEVLETKKEKLVCRSEGDGTIGNVFVDIDELVPPYGKLLSLYEKNPSQIKAFVSEVFASQLRVGDSVLVRASGRGIEAKGVIEEIGTRVTDYPQQFNPTNDRYGQEVFIRIPQIHTFLDGEKVLVYPTQLSK